MTTLLSMTISASVIIAVIIVIRSLFIHRLPKRLFVILWAAAALRMLVPFSVSFSIPHENTLPDNAIVREFTPSGSAGNSPGAGAAPDRGLIPGIVWAGGAVLSLGIVTALHLRSRRELSTALPFEDTGIKSRIAAEGLRRKITVKVSDRVTSPLTYGVINPVIVLPKGLPADSEEMRFALAHELTHIRRFDVLLKMVFTAAACVHWFNPLAWTMLSLAGRDIELSCDEAVLKQLGCDRADYAMALIRLEERRSIPTGAAFGRNAVRERIEAIMKFKKTTLAGIIVSACLIAGTTTAFAAVNSDRPTQEAAVSYTRCEQTAEDAGNGMSISMTTTVDASDDVAFYESTGTSEISVREISDESGQDQMYYRIVEDDTATTSDEPVYTTDEEISQYIIEDDGTVTPSDDSVYRTLDSLTEEEFFSRYSEYGLTYENGRLYYNGEPVKYFDDIADMYSTDDGGVTEFVAYLDSDGVVVLDVVREGATDDSAGELTGVRVISGEELEQKSADLDF